jgi:hypothetical protein
MVHAYHVELLSVIGWCCACCSRVSPQKVMFEIALFLLFADQAVVWHCVQHLLPHTAAGLCAADAAAAVGG